MRVVTLDPPHRFAYRWVTSREDDPSIPFEDMPTTLVEYVLESIPNGTQLTMVESGFASHPEDQRASNFEGNTQGWTGELAKLVAYSETLVAV